MSITTTAEPAEQQHQNVNLFLTLEEAGAMVRKSAVWVERHLTAYRRSGAPAVLAGFTSQDSERAAVKLVERDPWVAWVRSWGDKVAEKVADGTVAKPTVIPVGLQSTSMRRRAARGF